jgi:hypothetical protein
MNLAASPYDLSFLKNGVGTVLLEHRRTELACVALSASPQRHLCKVTVGISAASVRAASERIDWGFFRRPD